MLTGWLLTCDYWETKLLLRFRIYIVIIISLIRVHVCLKICETFCIKMRQFSEYSLYLHLSHYCNLKRMTHQTWLLINANYKTHDSWVVTILTFSLWLVEKPTLFSNFFVTFCWHATLLIIIWFLSNFRRGFSMDSPFWGENTKLVYLFIAQFIHLFMYTR